MGFNNRARDGQAHARALHPVSLIFAPIELVEKSGLVPCHHPGPLVGDTDFEVSAFQLSGDPDGRFGW